MRTVYLVILNCNNMNVLPALCESLDVFLKNNTYPIEVRFIDQGSTDGSYEYLENYCEHCIDCINANVKRLKINIGPTKAWNLAIKDICSNYKYYLCLINSDMKVGVDFLAPMIDIMEKVPDCGMVSNTLRDYENIDFVQNAGPNLDDPWHYKMGWHYYRGKDMRPHVAEWGHMGCTLFKSEVFWDIGKFDENFFIYSCDFDFQIRMKLAGWKIWFCPKSYAQHKTFITCNELKKNSIIAEICKKDGDYLHWKWGRNVLDWFNKNTSMDINRNLKDIHGEDYNLNEIYS